MRLTPITLARAFAHVSVLDPQSYVFATFTHNRLACTFCECFPPPPFAPCSTFQGSGEHQSLSFPGQQRRLCLGRDAGHRPLQRQDLPAGSYRLPELHTQVFRRLSTSKHRCVPSVTAAPHLFILLLLFFFFAVLWSSQTSSSLWSRFTAIGLKPVLQHLHWKRVTRP